jgi:hypothetical protein
VLKIEREACKGEKAESVTLTLREARYIKEVQKMSKSEGAFWLRPHLGLRTILVCRETVSL